MKILTWNIKRPKINEKRIHEITEIISDFNADLIFLTETNTCIDFPEYHKISTTELSSHYNGIDFQSGENKSTIYSKIQFSKSIDTYDGFSSVCVETNTEIGNLILYGSIIGFTGGRNKYFTEDLKMQKLDLQRIAQNGNLCFAGDLNISFSGYPYPSKDVQNDFTDFCEAENLKIITQDIANSALHIVLSRDLLRHKTVRINEIPIENRISDHNLILGEII